MMTFVIGLVTGFAFLATLAAAHRLGWRGGHEAGVEQGWREAVLEDEEADAGWEGRPIAVGLAHLMKGRAPIRRLN